MKFERNDHYFTIAVYVFFTSLAILTASCILRHFTQAVSILASMLALGYLLLEPLIGGLVIAYLMDPLVDFYERRCIRSLTFIFCHHKPHPEKKEKRWPMRTVPTLFAFITFFMIIGLFVMLMSMNIQQMAGEFTIVSFRESIKAFTRYFENMIIRISEVAASIGISTGSTYLLNQIYTSLNHYLLGFYTRLTGNLTTLGLHTMNWLLAFVIAFYLLQDSRRLWFVCKKLFSKLLGRHFKSLCYVSHKIDKVFAGYIRGELLDSLIVTILTSAALTCIQLNFSIIIGVISGIFNLIPYFGPIVGFILAVVIGLLDPNPMKALYGAAAILVIQQIDGWFIVPKIVGNSVNLHPVVVLLVILIGGSLFGLLGMLLAVPVTAVIRILLMYFFPDYFEESVHEDR